MPEDISILGKEKQQKPIFQYSSNMLQNRYFWLDRKADMTKSENLERLIIPRIIKAGNELN